jgi:hypothetical protein
VRWATRLAGRESFGKLRQGRKADLGCQWEKVSKKGRKVWSPSQKVVKLLWPMPIRPLPLKMSRSALALPGLRPSMAPLLYF